MAKGRRKKGGHGGGHADERWLVTYADLITLLMCLFMVLWSISSVNSSKFESLQRSLKEAFSGKILPGGQSVVQAGSTNAKAPQPIAPTVADARARDEQAGAKAEAKAAEDERLRRLKRRIDAAAKEAGVSGRVRTEITHRGLRVRLLTDRVVFDSGRADLKPQGRALLDAVARVLLSAGPRPIQIDGHTDSVPLSGGPYTDNWGLSSARAAAVVRRFVDDGFSPRRLTAGGHADNRPVATNATADGRARNRRVEILLSRTQAP
jgi:chemotaxis protein MotB